MTKYSSDQPRRDFLVLRQSTKGDFQLVQTLVPGLVDPRRLARGADKPRREEIGERRPVVPIGDEATEQVGPAKKGAVGGGGTAEHQVVSPARAGMPAVEQAVLRSQSREPGLLVKGRGVLNQLVPRERGPDVRGGGGPAER